MKILDRLRQLQLTLARIAELPSEVAELKSDLFRVRAASEATLSLLQRPRPRWAQLMVLWTVEPRAGAAWHAAVRRADGSIEDPAGAGLRELGPGLGTVDFPLTGGSFEAGRNKEPRPGYFGMSFDLNDEEIKRRGVWSEVMQIPVPAGAWLVAVGCTCSQVFVGTDLQDIGSGTQQLPVRVMQLRDSIGVGMRLRAAVQADDGGPY